MLYYQISYQLESVMAKSLQETTFALLCNTPLPIKKIASDTGLGEPWLARFKSSQDYDPSVNRVETLYVYLSGRELKLVDVA